MVFLLIRSRSKRAWPSIELMCLTWPSTMLWASILICFYGEGSAQPTLDYKIFSMSSISTLQSYHSMATTVFECSAKYAGRDTMGVPYLEVWSSFTASSSWMACYGTSGRSVGGLEVLKGMQTFWLSFSSPSFASPFFFFYSYDLNLNKWQPRN